MSVRAIEAEVSIKSGVQAECTIGREVVVEVHDDVNLESLTVTANGSYAPAGDVDGYSDVIVAVPERVPDIERLTVTANGTYTAEGDGYNPVTVSVPERIPVTESLSVTENGTYEPDSGVDGYNRVTVAVPERQPDIESLTATSNGTYTSGKDGYNPVVVAVPPSVPDIEPLTVTEDGTYAASGDGYNPVTVNTGVESLRQEIASAETASGCSPLTDCITALTIYANEVTGQEDETLSDAVTRLVDGYGTGGGYEGLEYVYGASGNTPISEVIWHGGNEIVNSCFNGLFNSVSKNIPISFSEPPTIVRTNAFLSTHLKIDWENFGSELLVAESYAFRIGYVDDCSSQIVRLPKFDGLSHEGISAGNSFSYTGPKAPGTYYFDTMQAIPREFFNNLSHTNFSATFGSIGHAVQSAGLYPFHNSTAAAVATITVYTTGEYLDTVKTSLEKAKGSGALTFIYKASEATEYNGTSYAAGDTILTSTPNS